MDHHYLALGAEAANISTQHLYQQHHATLQNTHMVEESLCGSDEKGAGGRRRRQLVPSEQKDEGYWMKRKKNNEAARRSREKRRTNDMMLERRLTELQKENQQLKAQLYAMQLRYGEFQPTQIVSAPQPVINTHQTEQLAHQHAHTQAMAAAASAAAAAMQLKKEQLAHQVNQIPVPVKKQKLIPEVILPDGRTLKLDQDSTAAQKLKVCDNSSTGRSSSPSPSESSSTPVIVDDEDVDIMTTSNPLVKSSSSGVSSDNESNSSKNQKSSGNAAEQLQQAVAAENSTESTATAALTEYYKQQFAALYAQNPAALSNPNLLTNMLAQPGNTTTSTATQLALNLLAKNSQ